MLILIHSTHYLFSDWLKAYKEFLKSDPGTHLAVDYTIIMCQGHSRSQVIMSVVHDF